MNGWICIHRKLADHPRYSDPEWVSVWLFVLLSAAHSEHRVIFDGREVVLQPGQFVSGRHVIAKATGVEETKVRRILKTLKDDGQIEQRAGAKGSLFTVTNWDSYQNQGPFRDVSESAHLNAQQNAQQNAQPDRAQDPGNHGAESASPQNPAQQNAQQNARGQCPANAQQMPSKCPQHNNRTRETRGEEHPALVFDGGNSPVAKRPMTVGQRIAIERKLSILRERRTQLRNQTADADMRRENPDKVAELKEVESKLRKLENLYLESE